MLFKEKTKKYSSKKVIPYRNDKSKGYTNLSELYCFNSPIWKYSQRVISDERVISNGFMVDDVIYFVLGMEMIRVIFGCSKYFFVDKTLLENCIYTCSILSEFIH